MAAITSAILGAASLGYGIFSRMEAADDAEAGYRTQQQGAQIQAEAARQAAGISREQAAASRNFAQREYDINAQASADSMSAFTQSSALNRNMVFIQQQQERLRMEAMEVDASRRSREMIRNQQRARAVALTNATAAGASRGTGLLGGYGQIAGQAGTALNSIQTSLLQGRQMFGLNQQMTDQRLGMSDLENWVMLSRANTQTAKANLALEYANINAGFQERQAGVQEFASQGGYYVNMGQGQVNAANNASNTAGMFIQAGMALPGIGQNLNNIYQTNWSQPTAIGSATSWVNPNYGRYSNEGYGAPYRG